MHFFEAVFFWPEQTGGLRTGVQNQLCPQATRRCPRDMCSLTVAWPRATYALRLARFSTVSLSRARGYTEPIRMASVCVRDFSRNQRRCFSASSPRRSDATSGHQGPPLVTGVESMGTGLSKVQWDDGHSAVFVNAWLRDHCRCADCLHQVCCCAITPSSQHNLAMYNGYHDATSMIGPGRLLFS